MRADAATNPTLRSVVHDSGYARRFSTERARRILRWDPRPSKDAIAAAADSMIERDLITP